MIAVVRKMTNKVMLVIEHLFIGERTETGLRRDMLTGGQWFIMMRKSKYRASVGLKLSEN